MSRAVVVACSVFVVYAFGAALFTAPGHFEAFTLWHPQGLVLAAIACVPVWAVTAPALSDCHSCSQLKGEVEALRAALLEDRR